MEWTLRETPSLGRNLKGVFYDNYFLEVVQERKERSFDNLVQGSMTVEQYAANSSSYLALDPT